MIRVAINGFDRIGRVFFRQVFDSTAIDVVAINDRFDVKGLAYLLQYDSVHGKFSEEVETAGDAVVTNNRKTTALQQARIKNLPWKKLDIDVVLEATGGLRTLSSAKKHLSRRASKVLITANPQKEMVGSIPRYVWGVNDKVYQGKKSFRPPPATRSVRHQW